MEVFYCVRVCVGGHIFVWKPMIQITCRLNHEGTKSCSCVRYDEPWNTQHAKLMRREAQRWRQSKYVAFWIFAQQTVLVFGFFFPPELQAIVTPDPSVSVNDAGREADLSGWIWQPGQTSCSRVRNTKIQLWWSLPPRQTTDLHSKATRSQTAADVCLSRGDNLQRSGGCN